MKMRFLMVAAAAVAFAAAAAFVAVFVIYSSASLAYFTHTHTRAHIASGFFFTFFVCLLFILHITLKLTEFCCHWRVVVTDFAAAACS